MLVGTDRGEIALHFNDAPGLNRRVCDNLGVRSTTSSSQAVPICPVAARADTDGPPTSVVTDVNEAYTNLGEASVAYDQLAGST